MEVRVIQNGRSDWWGTLEAAFRQASSDLGLGVLDAREQGPYDELPETGVVVYLNNHASSRDYDTARLQSYIAAGRCVLPVHEVGVPLSEMPLAPELQKVNALFVDPSKRHWVDAVVDEVMSELWIGRRSKKVFISYKRTDSAEVAAQIQAELMKRKYAVFLDDCSIEYGADFQRDLKYWLNDADLLLLLASPNFAESLWVKEEIEFALAHNVGIVVAKFDSTHSSPKVTGLLQRIPSDRHYHLPSFQGLLPAADLDALLATLARERSSALRARLESLLTPARDRIQREMKQVPDLPTGVADLQVPGKLFLRIVPYRPTVESLYGLCGEDVERVVCYYEENDPKHSSVEALRWALEGRRSKKPNEVMLWTRE